MERGNIKTQLSYENIAPMERVSKIDLLLIAPEERYFRSMVRPTIKKPLQGSGIMMGVIRRGDRTGRPCINWQAGVFELP
jgi:hypothetical protein